MTKFGKYGIVAAVALLAGATAPAAFAQANSSANDNNTQVTGSQTQSGAPGVVRGKGAAGVNTGAQIGNSSVNGSTNLQTGPGASSSGVHVQGDKAGGGAKTSGSNAD